MNRKLTIYFAGIAVIIGTLQAHAQDLSGAWRYEEQGERAELTLQHDATTNRISGTLSLFGVSLPVEGRATNGSFVLDRMAGQPVGSGMGLQGQLQNGVLTFVVRQPGEDLVTLRMRVWACRPLTALRCPQRLHRLVAPPSGRAALQESGIRRTTIRRKWRSLNFHRAVTAFRERLRFLSVATFRAE